MRRPLPTSLMVAAALVAGCGGGGHKTTTPAATKTPSTTTTPDPTAQLNHAARSAVQMNAQLSMYVLWHNAVPSWAAQSTRGPALAALRTSAAGRRAQRIQVRTVRQRVEILSLALDPSYLSATAKVRESGSVVPYRNGHRLGRPLRLNEMAEVQLHRLGSSARFVVWKVAAAK